MNDHDALLPGGGLRDKDREVCLAVGVEVATLVERIEVAGGKEPLGKGVRGVEPMGEARELSGLACGLA
jgi:hypothetical protein